MAPATPLTPVFSRYWDDPEPWSLDTYRRHDGYRALEKALAMDPDEVIALVKDSGLRGRGGAGFPTGTKWSFIPQDDTGAGAKPHYLVINADESEPGTCKDIPLMLTTPHFLVEGAIIAAYAIRAHHAFIYVRGEVVPVLRRLQAAVAEAYEAGYLGTDIKGSGFDLELVVHAGAGAYICGEETALLDSLEGRRGQPRLRPPFPAVAGLYACPTVVNNVESIASVPPIMLNGIDWFRSMGSEKSPGFTLYSLSGHVTNPGQYEAPLGITLRELLEYAGGVRAGHELKFWTPGGSSTPLLTAEHLDVPLDYEGMAGVGSMLGTKALQIFDETTCVVRAVRRWTRVLRPRIVRQVHAVPRGHLLAGPDLRAARDRARHRRGHREAAGHLRHHLRKVVLRVGRWRGQPDHVVDQVLPRRVRRAPGRRLPVRSARLDADGDRGGGCLMTRDRADSQDAPAVEMVNLTIDDVPISVPKGTLVIRAAELMGIQIPRFCDHPLLDPVGACRQCLVEVEGQRKPMASCTITCTPDMVVRTQFTSEAADKAQHGVMELLLINHPLDCPVCDKGGECPLQNQAMSNGRAETRFDDVKRTFPKPIPISSEVLLDRERCVLCARCTRFSQQIAGDPFIELLERGALQQVGIAPGEPFSSYFSGNTVQICPVGRADRHRLPVPGAAVRPGVQPERVRALRLGLRPAHRPSARKGVAPVGRRRPGGQRGVELRQGPVGVHLRHGVGDRITTPQIRDERRQAAVRVVVGGARAWPRRGLAAAAGRRRRAGRRPDAPSKTPTPTRSSPGWCLGTNDIDFRIRAHSRGGSRVPGADVAGQPMTVTYADLEKAPAVAAGRLRAGRGVADRLPAAAQGRPQERCAGARRRPVRHPRADQDVRQAHPHRPGRRSGGARRLHRRDAAQPARRDHPGRRAAGDVARSALRGKPIGRRRPAPGSAGCRGAPATAARWRPARCRTCCPAADPSPTRRRGNRPPPPGTSRTLPEAPGRDTAGILAAAADGELGALLIGGVELADLPDPDAALAAIDAVPFVVSLELRESAVTELADVVFPVAPVVEKAGSFVNWEGRIRPFEPSLPSNATPDLRVLYTLADEIGIDLGLPDAAAAGEELAKLGWWGGARPERPGRGGGHRRRAGQGRGGAGRLADAAGLRAAAGRRALSGRNRPAAGGPAVGGHRRRNRCGRRRFGHRRDGPGARSRCRWRSPTWMTGWSGCR